jgi:MYXO-CTERM domain-containing protein
MCPNNGVCVNGNCMPGDGSGGTTGTGGTDGGIDLGGNLNLSGSTGSGANNGTGANGGKPIVKDPGCACDVVGRSPAGSAAFVLTGLGVVLLGARRRKLAA